MGRRGGRRWRNPRAVTLLLDTDEEPPPGDAGAEPEPIDGPTFALRWTDRELLRAKDFARVHRSTSSTRRTASWATCTWSAPGVGLARQRPTSRRRGPIDVGATTRRALHTGGEPLRTVHRRAGDRPRRVVLLCDVSGSMEAYARALVRFAHVAVVGRAQVEVFTLGTRCTRITRELGSRDPDAALDAVAGAVEDWSGGTRLGEGLRTVQRAVGAARPGAGARWS